MDTNPFRNCIICWKRYTDDIFMIWEGSARDLSLFMDHLHNIQPHLRFTEHQSKTSIPFLDLLIKHEDQKLYTTLYRKPTDRNTLLLYKSFHPRSLRDGLPFGQFLRLRRNCARKTDYFQEAEILKGKLLARGYPKRLVNRSLKRAWFNPRETLLSKHDKVDRRASCRERV